MSDPRCDWCRERESEHTGFGVGCDEFLPIDWRARAHTILDKMIDNAEQIGVPPLSASPSLRAAICQHIRATRAAR